MQIPQPTNLQALKPHWFPLVEQCAAERSTSRLPSLESELGPGRYKLKGDRLDSLPHTHYRYRLQWRTSGGKHIQIGFFDAVHSICALKGSVEKEEYREVLELCERNGGSTIGLPGMEHLLGAGKYKSDPGVVRKDGRYSCILYWKLDCGGKYVRLGSFVLEKGAVQPPKHRTTQRRGPLVMGTDELGRRIIRVGAGPNSDMFLPVAVEYELVKGELMPKPVHDVVAQAFRV